MLRCGRESVLPNIGERLPLGAVRRFQHCKITLPLGFRFRSENDPGRVKPTKQLQEEKADGAPVKILERLDGQEPALGKGK
jgi:hypothetical protein